MATMSLNVVDLGPCIHLTGALQLSRRVPVLKNKQTCKPSNQPTNTQKPNKTQAKISFYQVAQKCLFSRKGGISEWILF